MKKFLLIFAFFTALFVGAVFTIALPRAEKKVEAILHTLGFKEALIQQSVFHLSGASFNTIQLDSDGFNTIQNLKIQTFWPRYLFKSQIDSIHIDELRLSVVPKELKRAISVFKKISNFQPLSSSDLKIDNIIIDVAIFKKALRLNGNLQIKKKEKAHDIKASLSAKQHELSFQSNWSGSIDETNNTIEINNLFEELKIHSTPIQINRGNGWLSYKADPQSNSLSGQFDAGSGKIFDAPMNNISLIIGQDKNVYPLVFRANASGVESVQMTSDFHYTNEAKNRKFNASLKIPDINQFLSYLKANEILDKSINKTNNIKQTDMFLSYVPEKRFAGGPLPFDIQIMVNQQEDTKGTFLIYPDSFDVRGTIESSQETSNFMKNIFLIPPENINDNVIRLDGNIKSLIN
mgnify:FL=1